MRNIQKLSGDMPIELSLLRDSSCPPQCIYKSPYTEDLLVGMSQSISNASIIMRYNIEDSGSQIEPEIIGYIENWFPTLWTDNVNGDIIVSGFYSGFKVMDRAGIHRFLYTKTPAGSLLSPKGLCTDPLSGFYRIMRSYDQQMWPVSFILPVKTMRCSLMYDYETHLLWVRDMSYIMSAYRYIERQDILTGNIFFI